MTFGLNPIEVIAVIFAFITLVKLVTIHVDKKAWHVNMVEPLYGNVDVSKGVLVVLSVVLLYYVLQTMTIVQVFAVLGLTSILMGLGVLEFYPKEVVALSKKLTAQKKLSPGQMVYMLLWAIISLWVIFVVLF